LDSEGDKMKKTYSTEEIYEIVSSKWNVDFPDGSVNEFELMCKAETLGFTEILFGTWIKQ
jgi:hypothetical protein